MTDLRENPANLRQWLHRIEEAGCGTEGELKFASRAAFRALTGAPAPKGPGLGIIPRGMIPLDREALTECSDLLDEIAEAVGDLPYRLAVLVLRRVSDIREHLHSAFPGGFAGCCAGCGEMLGVEEIAARDPDSGEICCHPCNRKSAPPPPSPEDDRLRDEAARLLDASADASTVDEAIELRMDAARSAEAARRADAAATQKLFSPAEAARLLGVSRATIYNLRKAGGIKLGKLLGRTVIARSEIERLVAEASRSPLNQPQEAAAQDTLDQRRPERSGRRQ